ncbi:MAG: sugar phosphate isomerase/epimerase [Firmicutes bacterium]|nr:sugar phosphate isomerase/epimerase [Bacillota bacterium]
MEIGVGTIVYELAGVPLKESVRKIAQHGVKYIDILSFGEYNPALLPTDEQDKIAASLRELGMKASSIVTCADGNLSSDDPAEVENAMEQLKLAGLLIKRLGGRQVLVGKGAGNIDFGLPRERAWANSVRVLKEYCQWALKHDLLVTLELEPEGLHVCNGVQAMRDLIDEVNQPNLLANIDIGHLNILRTSPDELALLKDKIIYVHISDNDGLAHTNSVIGTGTTKVRWYIDTLLELGIDEVAARYDEVAVAGVEIGAPGEYIQDADIRVLKSVGNVLSTVPGLRKVTAN